MLLSKANYISARVHACMGGHNENQTHYHGIASTIVCKLSLTGPPLFPNVYLSICGFVFNCGRVLYDTYNTKVSTRVYLDVEKLLRILSLLWHHREPDLYWCTLSTRIWLWCHDSITQCNTLVLVQQHTFQISLIFSLWKYGYVCKFFRCAVPDAQFGLPCPSCSLGRHGQWPRDLQLLVTYRCLSPSWCWWSLWPSWLQVCWPRVWVYYVHTSWPILPPFRRGSGGCSAASPAKRGETKISGLRFWTSLCPVLP